MSKIKLFLIILVFIGTALFCKDNNLKELVNPSSISVHNDCAYIIDAPSVLIYSLTDFSLKNKFGSKGEGPGSFMIYPGFASFSLNFHDDKILINSLCKVSYFSLDGNFLNELKHSVLYGGGQLWPVGNKFAGMGFKIKDSSAAATIDIYSKNLEKEREIFEFPISAGYNGIVLDKTIALQTAENKIFVLGSNTFLIEVFNAEGKKLFAISREYENLKFTPLHKQEILEFYEKDPVTKSLFPLFKDRLRYPSFLPAIKRLIIADSELYIQTYLRIENKTEFFVYDFNGNELKKIMLPLDQDELMDKYFLFCIKNRKLYQLIEKEDQTWDLDVLEIK